ncbi:hypothetical protein [Endozoicomonas sp. ALC066]|uniref:hypothetical protein n=1 Tax=Endozoicomonas sp. ALC066 TaxID=3403078 RepID=UPI003BB59B67
MPYIYGRKLKPVPAGYISIDSSQGIEAFGTVTYPSELSAETLDRYQMTNLNMKSYVGYTIEDAVKIIPWCKRFVRDFDQKALLLITDNLYGQKALSRLTANQWLEACTAGRKSHDLSIAGSLLDQAGQTSIELVHQQQDHQAQGRMVIVVPSTNKSNRHKLVYFDRLGPIGHCEGELMSLLRLAINQGYTQLAPGALDKLSDKFSC